MKTNQGATPDKNFLHLNPTNVRPPVFKEESTPILEKECINEIVKIE